MNLLTYYNPKCLIHEEHLRIPKESHPCKTCRMELTRSRGAGLPTWTPINLLSVCANAAHCRIPHCSNTSQSQHFIWAFKLCMDVTSTKCLFICVGLHVQPLRHLILNTKAESAAFMAGMMKHIMARHILTESRVRPLEKG